MPIITLHNVNKLYVIQWSKWLLRIKCKIYRKHKQAITCSIRHDYMTHILSLIGIGAKLKYKHRISWYGYFNYICILSWDFLYWHHLHVDSSLRMLVFINFEVDYPGNSLIALERNGDRGPCVNDKSLISANLQNNNDVIINGPLIGWIRRIAKPTKRYPWPALSK